MSAVDTAVRDRISEYLAGRGGFKAPEGAVDETNWESESGSICVSLFYGGLSVYRVKPWDDGWEVLSVPFSLRADAPDLLSRLGDTLDRLGV